uniref:tRNA (adenine(58)-N(1))-methyltransferase catalytic subunit TRMT61A-like n=1 Tax=Styela clava TaxID=7725 RepID=UPI00193AB0CD|nr:tRNA (adenine(58)-N(1))-methyltransferase catalytic subunit TRMT61A-like [Styela clava]
MSFNKYKSHVEEGDTAIVYTGFDSMFPVTVNRGKTTQTKYGAIKHDWLVGHEFGAKYQCSKGWVYILHPTPELWTVSLPHRTQILYATDIAMVTMQLDLKPGSVVCESGTGSGSLSHSILRTIMPNGYLHTVEFHEKRAQTAREEFKMHGFEDIVTVYHRDVIEEGFPIENEADAVFLDIPKPYDVIPHAIKALKRSGGRLCSFSPCVEQVQRTCLALHESGCFEDIETIELVTKPYNIRKTTLPIVNLGLSDPEVREALCGKAKGNPILPFAYEAGNCLPVGDVIMISENSNENTNSRRKQTLKRKQDWNDRNKVSRDKSADQMSKRAENDDSLSKEEKEPSTPTPPSFTKNLFSTRTCSSPKEIYGHTGYLTFATYCDL